MLKQLAVGYDTDAQRARAQQLAYHLTLEIDNTAPRQLIVTADKLMLKIAPFLPMSADFNSATWQKRRAAGKKQGLIRACRPAAGLRIIDATAGWGRDAAILASFGAEVLMLERQPAMALLLADALERCADVQEQRLKLSLKQTNAQDYLQSLTPNEYPDVIYLDPMHPVRQKSALVKKDLQVLQQLIGADNDVLALLTLAKSCVRQKVVVKWPQHEKALLSPSASIMGKTVRFDIYASILS